jgi:hypothetical protein
MPLRMTPKRYAERHAQMTQRLTQNMHDLFHQAAAQRTTAGRMYPNLKSASEPDQPKAPVQGWAHLNQQKETKT